MELSPQPPVSGTLQRPPLRRLHLEQRQKIRLEMAVRAADVDQLMAVAASANRTAGGTNLDSQLKIVSVTLPVIACAS